MFLFCLLLLERLEWLFFFYPYDLLRILEKLQKRKQIGPNFPNSLTNQFSLMRTANFGIAVWLWVCNFKAKAEPLCHPRLEIACSSKVLIQTSPQHSYYIVPHKRTSPVYQFFSFCYHKTIKFLYAECYKLLSNYSTFRLRSNAYPKPCFRPPDHYVSPPIRN